MSTVRITGGDFRGRKVLLPKQHHVRPTSDRARQAYFNIVSAAVPGSNFLDLFSGTGIFSFEALSRGAASAVAVEQSRGAAQQIRETAVALEVNLQVIQHDVMSAFPRLSDRTFDLVYADPPYDFDRYDHLLEKLDTALSLSGGAVVAIEHRSNDQPFSYSPVTLALRKRATYGSVTIALFDKEAA